MAAALLALALALPSHAPPADPTEGLRAYLDSCERFGFAGVVLVARKGEVLVAEGYGLAERESATPNGPETCFEIASATKPFTAIAVLQLAAEGKLSLDDGIAEHLPGVPEDKRGITLRHLLMHRSGMPRGAAGGRGEDLATAVAAYLAPPLEREPGAGYEYWNGGYALLAGVVEEVSGERYVDFCRARIFEPAGMERSGFTGDPRFEGLAVATGYEQTQPPRRADEHPYGSYGWQYRGMGGLVTTAPDLLRFALALQGDGLLPEEWREVLLTPGEGGYACGFYVLDQPRPTIAHGGDVRGFHTSFHLYPRDEVLTVVLCNVGGVPTWAIAENLRAIVLGDPSRYPAPPRPAPWKPKALEALAGSYARAPDERVELRVEGDALWLEAASVASTLRLWPAPIGRSQAPAAPTPELCERALRIARAVADGDPEPLRAAMLPSIAASWPDQVVGAIWKAHEERWGRLRELRVVGGLRAGERSTVLLALEHAKGAPRLSIEFQGERLAIFDLAGPRALARRRVVPDGDERLVGFAWMGAQSAPVELVRDRRKRVRGLRLDGVEYERE